MGRVSRVLLVASCLLLAGGLLATARAQQPGKAHLIAIYHVAPGQHLEFLKWQAAREAIAAEAGAAPTQWYRHTDGDSWDFISISEEPAPSQQEALDAKMEQLAKQKGLTTGFAASLEFRKFISSHTDTFAQGPFSAQEMVQQASGR
jgi:hypothetical protein